MPKITDAQYVTDTSGAGYVIGYLNGVFSRWPVSAFAANQWLTGAGVPTINTGSNGDFYIDAETLDVYKKENNVWGSSLLNIKGADGAQWHLGSGAPASGVGVNGDYYLDSGNFNVYNKDSGTWSLLGCIKGEDGVGGGGGGDFLVMQVFS